MKKINDLDLRRFRNNEHGQFHKVIQDEILAETPEKLNVIKLFNSYSDALSLELTTIEVEQGSQHTKTIEESDLYRDQLYRSFVLHIKACLLHYEIQVQDAAEKILRIINQVGDMRKLAYNLESESMASLINQLRNNYSSEITQCNATPLLDKLEEANNSFISDFGIRASEVSARISGDVRAARALVDDIYKNMVSIVNAMVLLNGESDYSTFIDKVNYLIDYYKNTINIRSLTAKDKTEAPKS